MMVIIIIIIVIITIISSYYCYYYYYGHKVIARTSMWESCEVIVPTTKEEAPDTGIIEYSII